MAADWPALRQEWVNNPAMQLKELAAKHGLPGATVRARANREDWQRERNAVQRDATQRATEAVVTSRAQQLARFNEDDLRVARAIRAKAVQMLGSARGASELRALASTLSEAQKIGRLALGATTENTGLSDPHGDPVAVSSVPVEEYLKARAAVLDEF